MDIGDSGIHAEAFVCEMKEYTINHSRIPNKSYLRCIPMGSDLGFQCDCGFFWALGLGLRCVYKCLGHPQAHMTEFRALGLRSFHHHSRSTARIAYASPETYSRRPALRSFRAQTFCREIELLLLSLPVLVINRRKSCSSTGTRDPKPQIAQEDEPLSGKP